jgi:hypothetical protein
MARFPVPKPSLFGTTQTAHPPIKGFNTLQPRPKHPFRNVGPNGVRPGKSKNETRNSGSFRFWSHLEGEPADPLSGEFVVGQVYQHKPPTHVERDFPNGTASRERVKHEVSWLCGRL